MTGLLKGDCPKADKAKRDSARIVFIGSNYGAGMSQTTNFSLEVFLRALIVWCIRFAASEPAKTRLALIVVFIASVIAFFAFTFPVFGRGT